VAKTNVILNSRPFTWQSIESPEYDYYVMNLRSIGCPESTVRDIIVADVNQLFERKRREMNASTNDVKWWLSDPDPADLRAALAQEQALDEERRRLLTRLLGANWDQEPEKEAAPVALAGPVLGALRPDLKDWVQDVVKRSRLQVRNYLTQCEETGESPDPVELARIREQTRQELSEQLQPEELEEFLLRHSNNAIQLRTELRGFNATPEEFRALFAATDPIDRELQLLGEDTGAEALAKRARLEQQREAAIRETLTPERFEEFRLLHDTDYLAAVVEARKAGAPAEAGRGLYDINQAAALERERISADPSLSDEEKDEELSEIEKQHKVARAALLGLPPPPEAASTPPPPNVFQHRVGPHETLAGLSLYYRVPLSDLLKANPGLDPGLIQPGRSVKIPEPPPLPWKEGIVPAR
jgi:LysM repeat protein